MQQCRRSAASRWRVVPLPEFGARLGRELVSGEGRKDNGVVVRRGNWKLIYRLEDGRQELYDTARDIGETRDVAGEHPDLVADLTAAMKAWMADARPPEMQRNPDYQARAASKRARSK